MRGPVLDPTTGAEPMGARTAANTAVDSQIRRTLRNSGFSLVVAGLSVVVFVAATSRGAARISAGIDVGDLVIAASEPAGDAAATSGSAGGTVPGLLSQRVLPLVAAGSEPLPMDTASCEVRHLC